MIPGRLPSVRRVGGAAAHVLLLGHAAAWEAPAPPAGPGLGGVLRAPWVSPPCYETARDVFCRARPKRGMRDPAVTPDTPFDFKCLEHG